MSVIRLDANEMGTIFLDNLSMATAINQTKRERKRHMTHCINMLAHSHIGPTAKEIMNIGLSSDRNGNLCIIADINK